MIINTPLENPNVSPETQKHLTSVQNRISLGEAELARLSSLVISLKYEVEQFVKQKNDLEEQVSTLSLKKDQAKADLATLSQEINDKKIEKEQLVKDIAAQYESINARLKVVEEKENQFTIDSEHLTKLIEQYAQEKKKFDLEKTAHEERVQKLIKALE